MKRSTELVWVTGTLVTSTRRALIIDLLDKYEQSTRRSVLARSLLHSQRSTLCSTSVDWQVPQWWAYQNKLKCA